MASWEVTLDIIQTIVACDERAREYLESTYVYPASDSSMLDPPANYDHRQQARARWILQQDRLSRFLEQVDRPGLLVNGNESSVGLVSMGTHSKLLLLRDGSATPPERATNRNLMPLIFLCHELQNEQPDDKKYMEFIGPIGMIRALVIQLVQMTARLFLQTEREPPNGRYPRIPHITSELVAASFAENVYDRFDAYFEVLKRMIGALPDDHIVTVIIDDIYNFERTNAPLAQHCMRRFAQFLREKQQRPGPDVGEVDGWSDCRLRLLVTAADQSITSLHWNVDRDGYPAPVMIETFYAPNDNVIGDEQLADLVRRFPHAWRAARPYEMPSRD